MYQVNYFAVIYRYPRNCQGQTEDIYIVGKCRDSRNRNRTYKGVYIPTSAKQMVTGVNATVNGGGGSGSTMTSSPAPPSGLGPAANGTSNSDQQMNGISIIEPAKRNGDNRRVSSGINSSVTSQLFFKNGQ